MPLSRRRFVEGAAALAATAPLPAIAQTPAAPDPRLLLAIRDHLGYSVGFRRKFGTGIYAAPGRTVPQSQLLMTLQSIRHRLAQFTGGPATCALIHWRAPDGRLHGWLLDGSGVIASGNGAEPYQSMDFLLDALRVDARTATRAPVKRGAPRPPPPSATAPTDPRAEFARARDRLLPGNIASTLAEGRGRLLILPARDTGSAPYAAMPLGDAMLADRWSTVILPDIETLADSRRVFDTRLNPRNALVVGNPDLSSDPAYEWSELPGAAEEAQAFARIFGVPPTRVLTGKAATRERVLAGIDNYGEASIVYLATHGLANSVNPMDGSFLALADGHLYGRDLRTKRFEAWAAWHPLVILSACQTALGKTFDGGTYGVARGWVSAGAGQVVASLWNVSDTATQLLMLHFAEHAFLKRKPPEEALRLAQLDARGAFGDDPAAWASFTLFGAPSASG
ncbi:MULTISPECIES: CHAT domain-containing protein [unclassified Sphingomonas]|uniref:CHAT domain-containing protein n=1 Tax=unclassified Sphingomonas TaxID=196159 RepID=UPI002151BE96|nr:MULTISPECIES: CHAT domain-containing protein [unclassified Sphingomonas]MCR5872162.1 CHAT domain-containing protein [Sphingomonas sp. J344]UUX99525.1 CHAT domain-containing protein [Sphingomonas sp. J315]